MTGNNFLGSRSLRCSWTYVREIVCLLARCANLTAVRQMISEVTWGNKTALWNSTLALKKSPNLFPLRNLSKTVEALFYGTYDKRIGNWYSSLANRDGYFTVEGNLVEPVEIINAKTLYSLARLEAAYWCMTLTALPKTARIIESDWNR